MEIITLTIILTLPQKTVPTGNTIGLNTSARFSAPQSRSTNANAKGKAVPNTYIQTETKEGREDIPGPRLV